MKPPIREPDTEANFASVIVVDGDPPRRGWGRLVAPGALVIAADGGALHALAEGVPVTEVVGDLDSLTDAEVAALDRAGTRVHRHPRDKESTDIELAARLTRTRAGDDFGDLLVVGGHGGRLDHALANIGVLAGPELADFRTTALLGDAVVRVAAPDQSVVVDGPPGEVVSLIPVDDQATGVATRGMRFELHHETLVPRRTRGISNRLAAPPATVSVESGRVLVIQPDAVPRLLACGGPHP